MNYMDAHMERGEAAVPEASTTAEQRRVWTEEQMDAPRPVPPLGGMTPAQGVVKQKHSHYYKDVSTLDFIDVYRVLHLFNVSDPCLQHAIKKLLVAGGRGAGKDINKDVREAQDSLARFLEMRDEETEHLLK
jgi:hypothetical protein